MCLKCPSAIAPSSLRGTATEITSSAFVENEILTLFLEKKNRNETSWTKHIIGSQCNICDSTAFLTPWERAPVRFFLPCFYLYLPRKDRGNLGDFSDPFSAKCAYWSATKWLHKAGLLIISKTLRRYFKYKMTPASFSEWFFAFNICRIRCESV